MDSFLRGVAIGLIFTPVFYVLRHTAQTEADYWIPALCLLVLIALVGVKIDRKLR